MAEAERLQQTEEVLKSRRNLIALSFVAIIILTINPQTITVKDWGLEIGIANSIPVKALLLFSMTFQLFVYYSRFNVRDWSIRLKDSYLQQEKLFERIKIINENHKEDSKNIITNNGTSDLLIPSARRSELNRLINDAEDMKNYLDKFTKKIFTYHVTTEVTIPCYISAFSIYWCTLDIIKLFSDRFNITALVNIQPFQQAVVGIIVTHILNIITKKIIAKNKPTL